MIEAGKHSGDDLVTWHPWQRRLHWLTVALLILAVSVGLYFTFTPSMPEQDFRGTFAWKFEFWMYNLHFIIGLTIVAVMMIRLLLRFVLPAPPLPPSMPIAHQRFANAVHFLIYCNIVFLAAVGYISLDAAATDIQFRLWNWIDEPDPDRAINLERVLLMFDLHFWGLMSLASLMVLHIGAALKHHFIDKDKVLQRMLPLVRYHDSARIGRK